MFLVFFFGVSTFAWVHKKSVQLWNADVDVPEQKRPLLQKIALEEAYEWQKDVFTKPPTRRRNPEVSKPKYDSKQADTIKAEKSAFLGALRTMYKAQVKQLKRERRNSSSGAQTDSNDDEDAGSVSSDSSNGDIDEDMDNTGEDEAADESEEASTKSNASSSLTKGRKRSSSTIASNKSTPKLRGVRSARGGKGGAKRGSRASRSVNSSSHVDDEDEARSEDAEDDNDTLGERMDDAEPEDEEEIEESVDKEEARSAGADTAEDEEGEDNQSRKGRSKARGSVSKSAMDVDEESTSSQLHTDAAPASADELTEIDLSSAIQRGKFILRARRNETPPPKKRKYTRRIPLGGTSPAAQTTANASHGNHTAEEEEDDDATEEESSTAHHNSKSRDSSKRTSKLSQSTSSAGNAKHSSNRTSTRLKELNHRSSRGDTHAESSPATVSSRGHASSQLSTSATLLDEHELEELRMTNTIAARRKLRKSGQHMELFSDDELVSLPLPTRTRASKQSTGAASLSTGASEASGAPLSGDSTQPGLPGASNTGTASSSAFPHLGSSIPSTSSPRGGAAASQATPAPLDSSALPSNTATPSVSLPQGKKTGRGKYIRRGKRENGSSVNGNLPDSLDSVLCSSCALAKPSTSRQPLGLFLFYLLEDQISSQRQRIPRYRCTSPHCHAAFYTEFELKTHSRHHFQLVEALYSIPPSKKPKLAEEDGTEDEPTQPAKSAPEAMDIDEEPSLGKKDKLSSTLQSQNAGDKTTEAQKTRQTSFLCSFPSCVEDDVPTFATEDELRSHVDKVHCGGLARQVCSRCGMRPIFSNTVPTAPRVGRYASRTVATPATNCTHGRGRKIPFEPLQGLEPPTMIPLPLFNLSYQPPPPAPMIIPSPSSAIHTPIPQLQATQQAVPTQETPQFTPVPARLPQQLSPPSQLIYSTQSGFPTMPAVSSLNGGADTALTQAASMVSSFPVPTVPASVSVASEEESSTANGDERPKRSTRLRRPSAAAAPSKMQLATGMGFSARELSYASAISGSGGSSSSAAARNATPKSTSRSTPASATAVVAPSPISAPPSFSTPVSAQASAKPKKGKTNTPSSRNSPVPMLPAPTPTAAPTVTVPPRAITPQKAQAESSPSDMGAFFDLINLCTSMVD